MRTTEFNNLEVGKKYYIHYDAHNTPLYNQCKHSGIFYKFIEMNGRKMAYFKKITNITKEKTHISEFPGYGYRNSSWSYYESKKENIQEKMENSALREILRRITRDEYMIEKYACLRY
jgi:hypothetical protein